MNTSQPVASYIASVDLRYLTSDEIEALSVKQIHNRDTFDTLLHPTPGGLYDPALGAWADNLCSTCHLNTYSCPGHAGHIELPVPVYHPIFLDQLLKLLRGRCEYCSRLKLGEASRHRFTCKLRLLRYGLLQEAQDLESVGFGSSNKAIGISTSGMGPEDQSDENKDLDAEELSKELIQKMNTFVRNAIKRAGGKLRLSTLALEKVEALFEERRTVVKEFLATITKIKACGSCAGVSGGFRKDKFNKIFRRLLNDKDGVKMTQAGKKAVNPLTTEIRAKNALLREKREDRVIDEGIVADLEEVISEEEEEEAEESEDIERPDINDSTANEIVLDAALSTPIITIAKRKERQAQEYVNALEVHAAISKLFEKDSEILSLVYNARPAIVESSKIFADGFFIHHLLVPPNKYRPEAKTSDGQLTENEQNALFKKILGQCSIMNQIRREIGGAPAASSFRRRDYNDFQNAWVGLQDAVNSLIDSDRNPIQGRGNATTEEGIKQKLEKKEGLFRMNMMGKRVNFAARSVISPDPNIETNEIGVPPVFAKKLTYPEPVTNHNFYDLKEAVLNGVDKWPGAAAIENENGQVINLRTKNIEERQALANQLLAPSNTSFTGAKNKKVHRHLNNGDIVLMNRQPTLHKPSIMGHRARVLPGEKTIRMHYANCNTYNADFDGDEMNMHFPQNEVARAEALEIADADHQYLAATSGKPLRGLIQDHLSMSLWLTNRDTMFDRADYQQLLYNCLRPENNHTTTNQIVSVPPAIIKPKQLWTGKQIITTILKNITPSSHPGLTLTGKSQIPADRWGENSEEGTVKFQLGELLCGVLDKAHLGPSPKGFIHAVHEAYGHRIAGKLLSILGRLLTKLLHMRAFSCGMEDIVFTKAGDFIRREKLEAAESIGLEVAAKYVTLDTKLRYHDPELRIRLEDVLRDEDKMSGLDIVYNRRTSTLSSDISMTCLPSALRKGFPNNQMQAMTLSGAKGSSVNANQISCNLGQQVLEGRRVPVMVSGKSLPCFRPFETKIRAGGYVTDRFLSGVKPQEYFFHTMAGREGLIDTAVKTSRSGYLQRCLIKGMEGLKVEYDSSVRDSDGTMVQFLYGEDGLDVTKQIHLMDFKFLAENFHSIIVQLNVLEDHQKIKVVSDEARRWHEDAMKSVRKSGDMAAKDPVLSCFSPGSTFGSTSEVFASELKAYIKENPQKLLKLKKKVLNGISKSSFTTLLDMKYMKSLVDPGEAVGIVAGQSIGEPSTQMTLNTFHLAGYSARNVTLGIPRLREIVMTASSHISTPSMILHLYPEITKEGGEKFAKGITRLALAEVLDKASVSENIGKGVGYDRAKTYNVRLDFYPSSEYCETYAIEIDDILRALEFRFVPQLIKIVRKELKSKGDAKLLKSPAQPIVGTSLRSKKVNNGPAVGNGEPTESPQASERDEDDDDEEEDDDTMNGRQRQNKGDSAGYDEPDKEEEVIAREARASSMDAEEADEGYSGSPAGQQADDFSEEEEQDTIRNIRGAAEERQARIISKNRDITEFRFDDRGGSYCNISLEYDVSTAKVLMLSLVEVACRSALIQFIPGLGTCRLSEEKLRDPITKKLIDVPVVVTEGVNLTAMHEYQHIVNPHQLFTNDIAAMLKFYGVEACRATIVREMDAVFQGHGITVDNRHLNLIADMMTRGGGFSAFNRLGMKSSVSPFMKMSFETTVGFLKDAVLGGDWDDLKGPSARIVTGKVAKVGTGMFDILTPVA